MNLGLPDTGIPVAHENPDKPPQKFRGQKTPININNFSGFSQEWVGVKIVVCCPFLSAKKGHTQTKFSGNLRQMPGQSRDIILPALLPKLVGDFFDFWEGNLAGNLGDFFGPTKYRFLQFGENFGAFFEGNFVAQKKYFVQTSGFLKRALAQTCLRAWYQVRFFRPIFGHSWGLVYGEGGRPWYGTSAQPDTHFTCSSPRGAPRVVPSTSLLDSFWAFLGALGRGEGAPLVRYLCKTQKSLHGRHVSRLF